VLGSGTSDLLMYIPDSLFACSQYGADPFVYLYAETGGQGGAMSNRAGDEAWTNFAAATTPVLLPPAVWLFGSGLAGLFGYSRRKASA